ncbi:PTS sugar transporter subunit IIB [Anoxybacterium hadale]|uniref:PTS sugar transporter subunit IIB n=1 Tax=Anoxybacterium hadale TaxID=3408580 RepID=A0ACD1AAC6_9FIRM|nr:PTS sugar transporter subunit IIB [Clostridiales bacterium]
MDIKKIQAVCGFGCGSSLFLRMKIQDILRENNLEAEVFCGDIGTCTTAPCDVIFTSAELAEQIMSRTKVPVVPISNFMNKEEIREKTLLFLSKS